MNPDTAKIIDRLVTSRDGLRKLDIADYAMIREAREALADAANALTNYAKTFMVIQETDQAAAPHLYPASGEVGAEIVRHMTHEEWRGCRIESYRWKSKIPEALQGSEWDWSYASHWSTPGAHEEAEALVSVKDAERAILSALSEATERAGRMEAARAHLDTLADLYRSQRDDAQAEATRLKEKLDEAGKVIAPFARAGTLAGPRGEHGDFWAYLPAAGPEFGIAGDHLRAALRWTETQGEGE